MSKYTHYKCEKYIYYESFYSKNTVGKNLSFLKRIMEYTMLA